MFSPLEKTNRNSWEDDLKVQIREHHSTAIITQVGCSQDA